MPRDGFPDIKVEIGAIVLAVEWHGRDSSFAMSEAYRGFLCGKQPDVTFAVRYASGPDLEQADKVFDSGGPWTLYRHDGRWCFVTPPASRRSKAYRVAAADADFNAGEIYMAGREVDRSRSRYPLAYPLEELLFMNLLSLGRGALLHACAVGDNGRGFIFAGTSGAGKSRMANLWKDQEGVSILSDDRVIVRETEGRFWAYGTPWHGEVKLCSPEKAPVDGIFFLRHGEENRAVPLEAPKALTSLFARSFPTYWNPEGMDFTLDFLSQVSQAVPCYDLEFLPDRSAIDFVRTVGEA